MRQKIILFLLTLTLSSILYAGELQPLSEKEMAMYDGAMASELMLSASFSGILSEIMEGQDYQSIYKNFLSADIEREPLIYRNADISFENGSLIIHDYSIKIPERNYQNIRIRDTEGPGFGSVHIGERELNIRGYIKISGKL